MIPQVYGGGRMHTCKNNYYEDGYKGQPIFPGQFSLAMVATKITQHMEIGKEKL